MATEGMTGDRRRNVWIAAVAAIVLAVSAIAAAGRVHDLEVTVFRAVNDLPQDLHVAIWPLMQYGTFITIPLLAIVALAFRRVRLALALAIAGIGVYAIAKVMKEIVDRGRPAALLDGVEGRETFHAESLGFPSGHAAVAGALTVVVAFQLSRRWAVAALVLGAVVLVGRLYVGAHLPLDVIGGAALGAIGGAIANLVVGTDRGLAEPVVQAEAAPPNRSSRM
jgi:membrane-associated phospholipid phosphatase